MPRDHTLAQLVQTIRSMTGLTKRTRLLLDEAGLVSPMAERDLVSTTDLLRFEQIPTDQLDLGTGEFLVTARFCRRSKAPADPVPLTKTFLFKMVPGELAKDAIQRIWAYHFFDTPLLPHVELRRRQTTLERNEAVDSLVGRSDVLMIVLPDAEQTGTLLRNGNWLTVLCLLGEGDT
jgi:hypothetical protein